jgi:hypothetical protein
VSFGFVVGGLLLIVSPQPTHATNTAKQAILLMDLIFAFPSRDGKRKERSGDYRE